MIQNGVKMELKFRGFKVSTKITKIEIFNVYGTLLRSDNWGETGGQYSSMLDPPLFIGHYLP